MGPPLLLPVGVGMPKLDGMLVVGIDRLVLGMRPVGREREPEGRVGKRPPVGDAPVGDELAPLVGELPPVGRRPPEGESAPAQSPAQPNFGSVSPRSRLAA